MQKYTHNQIDASWNVGENRSFAGVLDFVQESIQQSANRPG